MLVASGLRFAACPSVCMFVYMPVWFCVADFMYVDMHVFLYVFCLHWCPLVWRFIDWSIACWVNWLIACMFAYLHYWPPAWLPDCTLDCVIDCLVDWLLSRALDFVIDCLFDCWIDWLIDCFCLNGLLIDCMFDWFCFDWWISWFIGCLIVSWLALTVIGDVDWRL